MAFAFVAYTIIFLGIAWYVFNIGQQQSKLSKQIEALEAAAEAKVEASARRA